MHIGSITNVERDKLTAMHSETNGTY